MYTDTITLFNRYHSRLGDIWFPHVIKGVDLNIDKASILAKYGAESKDGATLHIKYQKGQDGQPTIAGVPYKLPKEWAQLTNDQLGSYITLNDDAESFDFFVEGEITEEPVNDDDYTNGFYNYMNRTKDHCFAITAVSKKDLIPHFEVMAR